MSYMTPPQWHHGRMKLVKVMDALKLLNFLDAAAQVQEARDAYDAMQEFASALYVPGDTITFQLDKYQLDNLTQFLEAVKERPNDLIGGWDTGDWWGEVLYKLRALGGEKEKGNRGPVKQP